MITTRGDTASASIGHHGDQDDDIIGEEIRPSPVQTMDTKLQTLYTILQDHTYSVQQPPSRPAIVEASVSVSIQPSVPVHVVTTTVSTPSPLPANAANVTVPSTVTASTPSGINYQNAIPIGNTVHVYPTKTSSGFTYIYNPTGKKISPIPSFIEIITLFVIRKR